MVMLAAGAGSLAVWSGLKAVASESREAWVSRCLIFPSQLGITFSLAGSATLVLLRLRSWFQFEQRDSSADQLRMSMRPHEATGPPIVNSCRYRCSEVSRMAG